MYAQIAFQQKIGDRETLTYKIPQELEGKIKAGHLVAVPLRKAIKTGLVWSISKQEPNFKTIEINGMIDKDPLLTEPQIALANFISGYYFAPPYKVLKLFVPARIFKGKAMRVKKIEEKIPAKKELKTLSPDQKSALDFPLNKFLIHGITGSGKTEIYLHLAKKELEKENQVLILVPEISLTPQTVEYFESRLQIKAAVIHSRLSEGEKYKTWLDIHTCRKNLVIGSRSAIFSPFTKLSLIIIDEEHEYSYKQDQSPRYTTMTVAEKMQELADQTNATKIKLVLGSATPSIETREKFVDATIELNERIGNAKLPTIKLVDMREEFRKGNKSIFSDLLHAKIEQTLAENKQVILFLNRRGSASSIVCRDCGYRLKCDDCDISMTYHAKTLGKPVVICHHCGAVGKIPINCPNCKSVNIRYLGTGTERIEEETKKLFKNAKVLRADRDTTSHKNSFEQIYCSFKNHEADILIGTQMIGKGLHIPNVKLVGVILADIGLNIPDFKSSERNFQLLTQVAGRAGRADIPNELGEVIIQTYSPEHFALQATESQDYDKFFNIERSQRKLLNYPPFTNLAKLSIENESFLKAKSKAEEVEKILKQELSKNPDLKETVQEITSYPAFIMRLHKKFRYRILIKGKNPSALISKLTPETRDQIKIDIDPISTN